MGEESDSKHISGYLNIIDSIGIIKITNRRWFVLGQKSQYMYYYKTPRDTNPAGKIDISTAVFLYDRKNPCCMQIKTTNGEYVLEAPDFNLRMKWLEALQERRRAWCSLASVSSFTSLDHQQQSLTRRPDDAIEAADASAPADPLPGLSTFLSANYSALDDNDVEGRRLLDATPNLGGKQPTSVFYINNTSASSPSDDVIVDMKPDVMPSHRQSALASSSSCDRTTPTASTRKPLTPSPASSLRHKVRSSNDYHNSEPSVADNAMDKVAKMLFRISASRKPCDNCSEMISVVSVLKTRCMDLMDEVAANRILVESLRANLLAAKNQANALQRLAEFKDEDQHKIDYIKESETERTYLHLQNSNLRKESNEVKDRIRTLEANLKFKSDELEAYKDSIKSKDKMIMKLVEEQSEADNNVQKRLPKRRGSCEIIVDEAIEFEGSACESLTGLSELKVNDVTENKLENLKDLLRGYEKQNQFLNKEILELHNIVQCLEVRERRLARKNFDIEAEYYQLKSRYLLLLNHFKPNKELSPGVVDELLKDAKEALISITANQRLDITDDIGFYITATNAKSTNFENSFVDVASQFKKVSDELTEKQKRVASEQYLSWLTKWDSLLVNYTDKTLGPCNELKELIRDGIPHTYRSRVWKSIIYWLIKDKMADAGNGYFECLYKKANTLNLQDAYDPAMKQIDLDLTRTLPHNKYFEDLNASKVESLRRVLYAYRWHNPDIGYCQGLNRLAAVSLLYLSEEDAFWSLVAIVEHLQPDDYYGNTMLGAQADQRVLRDFVMDKMPKVSSHLRSLEVDLSLFTFNWFLTVFVDSFLHSTYLNIWDSFLYEGNKVLFRFALAAIKLNENEMLACKTATSLHSCISKLGENNISFDKLSQIAFKDMNPFSSKQVECRRSHHLSQLKIEMDNLNRRRGERRK